MTMVCEKMLNHMKHLELYKKEGETNMKYPIKPGDFVRLKPFHEVCDEYEMYAHGIDKKTYTELSKEPICIVDVQSDPDSRFPLPNKFYVYGKNGERYMIPSIFIDKILTKKTKDNVNHPNHYNQNGMEVWDVIKAFTSDISGVEAFYAGNVIKYVLRWNHKNGIEDLEKAKVYIDKLIESRKEE